MLAIATVVAAQLLDFATFLLMVRAHGPQTEANPLVAHLFAELGSPAVLAAKLFLILLVVGLALAGSLRGRHPVWQFIAAAPIALAILAGVVGGWSNATVLLA